MNVSMGWCRKSGCWKYHNPLAKKTDTFLYTKTYNPLDSNLDDQIFKRGDKSDSPNERCLFKRGVGMGGIGLLFCQIA